MGTSYFDNYFQTITNRLGDIAIDALLEGVGLIKDAREAGAKVILAGNGGSAAMASHVTVDLLKCANVHAINLMRPTSLPALPTTMGMLIGLRRR